MVEVSARMGWTSATVKKEQKTLEWTQGLLGRGKYGVLAEFSELVFHFTAKTGLDEILEDLYTQI